MFFGDFFVSFFIYDILLELDFFRVVGFSVGSCGWGLGFFLWGA